MKIRLISFIFLITIPEIGAQSDSLRSNIWLLGYDSNPNDLNYGGTSLSFDPLPLSVEYVYREMNFATTNSSICDTEGNLLFYSNGVFIANSENEVIENGGSLAPGGINPQYANFGLIASQGALILPIPQSESQYIMFHGEMGAIEIPYLDIAYTSLYYSTIDMEANNGQGKVLEKNVVLKSDTLDLGKITAVRHGNGRDWWILIHEHNTNKYYRYLLSPEGIIEESEQVIGENVTSGLGQSVFSPDGTKFVSNNLVGGLGGPDFLSIYDFDRCSGLLNNQLHFSYADSAYAGGVAISPNSRFVYVCHSNFVFQYDLHADNIEGSIDTVAVFDGYEDPFPAMFNLAQLSYQDNKIYINTPNGSKVLHVIHNPNEKGEGCNLEQHAIQLPTYNRYSIPNFPNFRLGSIPDSPCDTIVSGTELNSPPKVEILLFPNPCSEGVNVIISDYLPRDAKVVLYDAIGQHHKVQSLQTGWNNLRLDGLNAGLYFYEIWEGQVLLESGKLVKVE